MHGSVIHIFGASDSATSTLDSYISTRFDYSFMDTDDYYLEADKSALQRGATCFDATGTDERLHRKIWRRGDFRLAL